MTEFSVTQLWRYPVKSMQGECLDSAEITPKGIRYDRSWTIRDEATKTIRGAKHFGKLLNFSARFLDDFLSPTIPHVEVTMPDGDHIRSDDPKIHEAISDGLGREVTLWSLMPKDDDAHYALNAKIEGSPVEEWRRVFGLEEGEAIPDMSGFPKEMLAEFSSFATPRGTYFDAYPIDILTMASLRKLASICPDADLDVRRFRPNIVLADKAELCSFAEIDWIGKRVQIGTVAFDVEVETVRCVMVTHAQPGLERDGSIMRALIREAKQRLSVYADVVVPGTIRHGDTVCVRDRKAITS